MKKIDQNGLLLCDMQAKAFELSRSRQKTSSAVFIRRFMNSAAAKRLDNLTILQSTAQARDLLDYVEEEYGKSDYGSETYSANELYWIGYIYRYFAYTYEKSSVQVYRIIKPKELRELFLAYHTMDPAQAIDRILEAKGLTGPNDEAEKRQYEIYKRIFLKNALSRTMSLAPPKIKKTLHMRKKVL